MDARSVTRALEGIWYGSYGRVACPVHKGEDPNLSIFDGEGGGLGLSCKSHACAYGDIMRELRERGIELDSDGPAVGASPQRSAQERIARANEMWRPGRHDRDGSASIYFQSRGIRLAVPKAIREAMMWCPSERVYLPCVIAAMRDVSGRLTAVQRTWFYIEGDTVYRVEPRMSIGVQSGSAVRIAKPKNGVLGIAEGVETALSAMQLFKVPCWVALSAGNMANIELPKEVERVVFYADGDAEGKSAAMRAAMSCRRQGRQASVVRPNNPGDDWNDILRGGEG